MESISQYGKYHWADFRCVTTGSLFAKVGEKLNYLGSNKNQRSCDGLNCFGIRKNQQPRNEGTGEKVRHNGQQRKVKCSYNQQAFNPIHSKFDGQSSSKQEIYQFYQIFYQLRFHDEDERKFVDVEIILCRDAFF